MTKPEDMTAEELLHDHNRMALNTFRTDNDVKHARVLDNEILARLRAYDAAKERAEGWINNLGPANPAVCSLVALDISEAMDKARKGSGE